MNGLSREKQVLEEIRRKLAAQSGTLAGYRAVLFGSRARGAARERSDFDIGICGDRPVPSGVLQRIRDCLDEIETLYRIDVVDLQSVPDRFRRDALEHAEAIFG
jgi:predicted nucleotidyltransferase